MGFEKHNFGYLNELFGTNAGISQNYISAIEEIVSDQSLNFINIVNKKQDY